MEVKQELKDYRFRAVLRSGKKGDHAICIDARKFAIRNNVSKKGGLYRLNLEQIQLEFGEDLAMEFWEVLMYMLPQERVKEAIREYVEIL
ncbi:hypothetical protein Asulf_00954 [Archaeoglobus sulfaticallidus PM70-1]|uniref:Uncharacterized protein n=1 Tax=Archaeoglobus sulfaticallidus PM70-1 TaxID=387631 RepID=N0BD76_9EURY|nr:hypothetical protein [Archaeoglobus sulfaticallidus]AGK60958.1 hypothetical protein Asulf_00954 [Archaeoglobus sulfaticallidus PM70-1]